MARSKFSQDEIEELTPAPLATRLKMEVNSRGNVNSLFGNQFFQKFNPMEATAYINGFLDVALDSMGVEEAEAIISTVQAKMEAKKKDEIEMYKQKLKELGYTGKVE